MRGEQLEEWRESADAELNRQSARSSKADVNPGVEATRAEPGKLVTQHGDDISGPSVTGLFYACTAFAVYPSYSMRSLQSLGYPSGFDLLIALHTPNLVGSPGNLPPAISGLKWPDIL
ncbi:hypothetical protein B0H10DRAFT_2206635 [Mycena sp. CBHHK59/15]|nr:hypothetical protein B0H10DRAFT_2206635 [Mycena sp. CBHHK59/15]